jgi:prepilin-type N-terminal cleavage/methylation domain-containing protein
MAMGSTVQVRRGFTLIEALVAMVVLAFGMLAIAGFQVTLSRNSEVSKQRSEAVRLGQLKLEELRSFQTVTSDGAGGAYDYVSDVVSGTDMILPTGANAYATNTSFTRTWGLTRADGVTAATGSDLEKWVNVLVTWQDRTGQSQEVRLRSVISRSDPIDLGTLFTGPGGQKARTPKNRNINIPYPAVDLAGGKTSAFRPPGAGVTFVFDNVTGDVLGFCNQALAAGASVSLTGTVTGGCTAEKAFLLSGYIHFLNSSPSGLEAVQDRAVTNPNNPTRDLTIGIDFLSASAIAPKCFAQRQKVVRIGSIADPRNIQDAERTGGVTTVTTQGSNHGFAVGDVISVNGVSGGAFDGVFTITAKTTTTFQFADDRPDDNATNNTGFATVVQELIIGESDTVASQYNTVVSRFVAYTCIVRPLDEDSDSATPDTWSGQARIQGSVAITSIGRASNAVTVNTSTPHQFNLGQTITISGVTGFDATVTVTPVDADTFTYTESGADLTGTVGTTSYATPGSGGTWTLGSTDDTTVATTSKICRFTGDYKDDNAMSNTEHPLTYRKVSGALDNQNYLVVPYGVTFTPGNTACPSDTQPDPVSSNDYLNTHAALHQNTITGPRPYGGDLSQSTQWGATSTSGEQGTETFFPMFCPGCTP